MTIVSESDTAIETWSHTPGFSLGASQRTFSVSTAASTWPTYAAGSEPFLAGYAFADAGMAAGFRAAMGLWDSIIAANFTEVADNASTRGEVRVAYTDMTGANTGFSAYAYSGTPTSPGSKVGDIWVSSSLKAASFAAGTFNYQLLLHEIGHTIGLKHSFDQPGVPAGYDISNFTIMSYTSPGTFWTFTGNSNSINARGDYPVAITPMVLDIAAAQRIYGAETTTRTGNDVYTFNAWSSVLQTIYDAGGTDEFNVAAVTLPNIIDLRPGGYSSIGMADAAAQIEYWSAQFPNFRNFVTSTINGTSNLYTFANNVGIAQTTTIENAVGGSGRDTIIGNDANNNLAGNDGDDSIAGGLGNDTLTGGIGNDSLLGEGGADYLSGGDGADQLYEISGANTMIGGLGNDSLYGGVDAETLSGGDGSDILVGYSNAVYNGSGGADSLDGGAGSDTIYLIGRNSTALGGDGDDRISMFALGSADGGPGSDGIDFFFSGSPDAIKLNLSSFQSNGIISLAGGSIAGFEYYSFTIDGSALADVIVGGAIAEMINGGNGNDTLSGGAGNDTLIGGAGANQLFGGTGDDIYVVAATTATEAVQQTLYEAAGEGTDEVQVTASVFALEWFGASALEKLTATDTAGHAGLIGNSLDNTITGNTGADELYGRAGNDTLTGGSGMANTLVGNSGDDTYVIAAAGDSVIEFAGEGSDTVQTALGSFTLSANVENLTYTGSATFIGVGSGDANRITGGGGADQLNGAGGNDTLIGGGSADLLQGGNGADQFLYTATTDGMDRILDFVSGTDKLALLGSAFTHTAMVDFVAGAVATSANSTVLYDINTGIILYDPDGTGSQSAIQIAQLNPGQTFTSSDVVFI